MKKSSQIIKHIIVAAVLAVLLVLCLWQYGTIQKSRVLSMSTTFSYMQEMIEEETEISFQNWEQKAEQLYRFEDLLPQTESLGDFREVKEVIHDVSQITAPDDAESALLITKAKEMKIATDTKFGKWSIQIINK